MNSASININARYYLAPFSNWSRGQSWDVIDRARELQFLPAIIFSNGTETECREWVLRNCEEPGEHTKGPWRYTRKYSITATLCEWPENEHGGKFASDMVAQVTERLDSDFAANAHLISTAPELLALLEQYHSSMPTNESGKLICQAKGWLIQE